MQKIYLARHGKTKWNTTMQHTSFTDINLTKEGKSQALALKKILNNKQFAAVFTSSSIRAKKTCELVGFKGQVEPDLVEWNYGEYEGLTTKQIHEIIPNWNVFEYGCPAGESIKEVTSRAKKVINKLKKIKGDILLFSHGHFSRVLIACWLGFSAKEGIFFASSNASLTILGYEHNRPILKVLNDTCHLSTCHC